MSGAGQILTVQVPLAFRKRGGRKLAIAPAGAAATIHFQPRVDVTLVKVLARAFRWRRMLEAGRYGDIKELAGAEQINPSYVSRVLRLTLLAPDIVEAVLDGRQDSSLTLPALMLPLPPDWHDQHRALSASHP